MSYRRPSRAPGFSYCGLHRYFLTLCTDGRRRIFRSALVVEGVRLHLQHAAATEGFAIIAYCFMPDHLHLLVEGLKESSDLRRFVSSFKQRSGSAYRRGTGQCLWQPGYYDHVLRDEQSMQATAGYTLQNPVRAGLVARMEQYPHMGSDRWEFSHLMQARAPRQTGG